MVASVLAISVGGISNDTESGNRESGEHDRAQRGQGSTAVYSLGRSPLIDSIVLQKLDGRLAKPGWID